MLYNGPSIKPFLLRAFALNGPTGKAASIMPYYTVTWNMETVETHCEDKPLDIIPYRDSCCNDHDFGFGMNWSGVIQDNRVRHYKKNP